ncbi:NifB/NifX family molybdenum-iron cluster-binding protein [Desulforhopalus singaporensis]|uniref:Predicted Fe-Mo cluster-binding protein, NifX family n=1 Tax=Desulforhopalus singaporensis TaxID=91360 RepID=A0A1H0M0B9_9BACT|nr:NifB/NifX family molybdenum-iron cluster-binding protein [Desulforhopalus singaporensis]SDO73825.1 Predicted Fe-Mo cluster-binding protein, NifX family [Desulforhopalus singaporensis]
MNVAITVWGSRISPVFDASRCLLVIELSEGVVREESLQIVQGSPVDWFLEMSSQVNVDVLVCGAICRRWLKRIETLGIEVVSFVAGEVEPLLIQLALGGELDGFIMPGCETGRCCGKLRGDRGSES